MTVAVTFDLDGTLTTFDTPWVEIAGSALESDPDSAVVETFSETLQEALREGRMDSIEHAAAVTVRDHALDTDPAAVAQTFRDREVGATVAVPGARTLVDHFAQRGPTGILTNGDDALQRRKAAAIGLGERVDAIIVSGGIGARKPDPEIFEAAAERLTADQYLHVGDDRTEDVGGALAAGWEAIHVDRSADPEMPVATITDVSRAADLF